MYSQSFKKFRNAEDGNITMDWIVLTAGMMLLAETVATFLTAPTGATAMKINSSLESVDPSN